MSEQHGFKIDFDGEPSAAKHIRKFEDIPDIFTMDAPSVEYLVPSLGIARNTIVLWTGADGSGKTYLAQSMALAVARGDMFLGMRCPKTPIVYVDLENPAYVVQDRLETLTSEDTEGAPKPENLKVWGNWCIQQPPMAGSELLLSFAKEVRPLIIVDPFRFFHDRDENSASEMTPVMQYLRACAACGAAVIILHHPSRGADSTGRGSTAIRAASDLAFMHTFDEESSQITLKVDKNRHGARRSFTIRADFEEGRFAMADAPFITQRKDELDRLDKIIRGTPGIGVNAMAKEAGIGKVRLGRLLKEGIDQRLWVSRPGPKNSTCYFPLDWFQEFQNHSEPIEPQKRGGMSGSAVLSSLEENHRTTPARPAAERLCSKHGHHPAWALVKGVWLCEKCHPSDGMVLQ